MTITEKRDGWLIVANEAPTVRYRVLLLPGLLCTDLIFADMLADPAMAQAGILMMAGNPPGFKGQPAPPEFDYGVPAYAGMVEKFALAQKCDLIVGHSFFGNVLIEMLPTTSFQGKIMLLSPSLYRLAEPNDTRTLDSYSRKPLLSGTVWWVTYLMLKSIFKPYFTAEKHDRLDGVVADAKKTPRPVCRQLIMSLFNQIDGHKDLSPLVASSKLPLWYVRGTEDNIGFSDDVRQAVTAGPKVKLIDISGSRHFVMLDKPLDVNRLIASALGISG